MYEMLKIVSGLQFAISDRVVFSLTTVNLTIKIKIN